MNPNTIIEKYPSYINLSKISTLARKLTEKSYFGVNVLKRCTFSGCREAPGLPLKELNDLKALLFSMLPQYWTNSVEFENVWVKRTMLVGQLCKTIRGKQ